MVTKKSKAKTSDQGKPVKDGAEVGYVLASGEQAGDIVPCVVLEQRVNEETGEVRAMLARAEDPEMPWQSWALRDEKHTPGTWHEL